MRGIRIDRLLLADNFRCACPESLAGRGHGRDFEGKENFAACGGDREDYEKC